MPDAPVVPQAQSVADEARVVRDEAPADMAPPAVAPVVPEPTDPEPAELDPRALKALSRQERKEAKSALRREQAEARNAARQAKALAKAAAKAGQAAPAAAAQTVDGDVAEGPGHEVPVPNAGTAAVVDDATAEIPAVTEAQVEPPATPAAPTDPRSRAAARVQRRLGKDAEKLTAADARARAREEARRRRAQAKELRSGVVAAEEPVVREADEVAAPSDRDEAVEALVEQTVVSEPILDEPILEEPVVEETAVIEPVVDEPVIEPPVIEPPVVEEPVAEEPVAEEPGDDEMGRPSPAARIDEPAPAAVQPAAEAPTAEAPRVEVQRKAATPVVPTTLPMDSEEKAKRPSSLGPIAGIIGLIALGISVLLAIGALLVALGLDSGGLYNVLQSVANVLVGPLNNAFDFAGASAERKENFLAWGAGSIGYLVLSFIGQAVQRANTEDE